MNRVWSKPLSVVLTVLMLLVMVSAPTAKGSSAIEKTFTTSSDFSAGTSINVTTDVPDQLQLDDTTKPFGFIWVAVSSKGTAVKIDTETGKVLGEYSTAPAGQPKNPSRTTVDKNGSVWIANRDGHSVTRIVLPESGLWVDKNGNGKLDTSTGLGDIRPWTNAAGTDSAGGVSTAEDELITNYVLVNSWGTRHVSVDKNNDVWVSGLSDRKFDLIDGTTGTIKRSEGSVGFGGYGGLIDKNGVIWSSNYLLRWDTAKSLTGPNGTNWTGYYHDSYGLGIDNEGNVWNSSLYGNQIRKFAPDGTLLGTYGHGYNNAQGVVADSKGDIWVAHSLWGNTVGHLKNDGTFVGNVNVGSGPTGVSVDAKGKIWATNHNDGTVSRIDPTKGPLGADGVTPVGQVDLTTVNLGGNLYNYSDMTGSTLIGAPNFGSWSTVYDSGEANNEWGKIDWNDLVTDDGSISVNLQSSEDGVNYSDQQTVLNHDDMGVPDGRFLKITVNFKRSSTGVSPILYDLTVRSGFIPQPPAVQITNVPSSPVAVNTTVNVAATFSDPDIPDSHTAQWFWGDSSNSAGDVTEANGAVTGSHTYSTPGVYTVKITVTDQYSLQAEDVYQYLIVYDPSAGFVTGGGWIDSPQGAYVKDPSLTGKANFGFISKYQKGANVPTGQTEFQFKLGNLNFHSTSYDWLVIAGARAQYKGTGTINGTGDFKFMLTAIDGNISGGGDLDRFRIKIWEQATGNVIYDNLSGDADDAQPIGIAGGSIVIHK